jgi:hypothetical protein
MSAIQTADPKHIIKIAKRYKAQCEKERSQFIDYSFLWLERNGWENTYPKTLKEDYEEVLTRQTASVMAYEMRQQDVMTEEELAEVLADCRKMEAQFDNDRMW